MKRENLNIGKNIGIEKGGIITTKKKAIIRSRKEDKGKGKKGKKLQIDVMSQRGKNKQTNTTTNQPTKQTKIQKERKDTSM